MSADTSLKEALEKVTSVEADSIEATSVMPQNCKMYSSSSEDNRVAKCYVCKAVVGKHHMIKVGQNVNEKGSDRYVWRCDYRDCRPGGKNWRVHFMGSTSMCKYYLCTVTKDDLEQMTAERREMVKGWLEQASITPKEGGTNGGGPTQKAITGKSSPKTQARRSKVQAARVRKLLGPSLLKEAEDEEKRAKAHVPYSKRKGRSAGGKRTRR